MKSKNLRVPYGLSVHGKEEIEAVTKVLKSNTQMGKNVLNFENKVSKLFSKKYGLMVNSGSSANLLAMAALVNPERRHRLFKGDEVLVPCVCWSTSVFPIIQCGLKPILVDCDPTTMNMSVEDFKSKLTAKTSSQRTI